MAGHDAAGEATVSLDAAFAHATAMLGRDPRMALAQARERIAANSFGAITAIKRLD